MKENRAEQQFIKKNHPLYEIVDNHCFYSKNVYNQANYLVRQVFIKEYNEFLKEMNVALQHHYANYRHHPEHF